MTHARIAIIGIALGFVLSSVSAGTVEAQRRDHLTKEEIELVRDVQDVDYRMELFVNAIERRLWVIKGRQHMTKEQTKRYEKDLDKWGELPKGSRFDLFSDVEKILNESIDKIEDVYDREPESALLPFAYYVIADYCEQLRPRLQSFAESTNDRGELGRLERAAGHCRNILEVRPFPRPTGKRPKSKTTR